MDESKGEVSTEVGGQEVDRKKSLAALEERWEENTRKATECLARMEAQIKENKNMVSKLKAIDKKNAIIWNRCGLKLGQNEGKSPFLFLEQVAPEAFQGLSEWTEKTRRGAIEEIEALGFNFAEMRREAADRKVKNGIGALIASVTKGKSTEASAAQPAKKLVKRVVRRVRAW
ncbi:MAG: hypothetical protein LBJ94_04050 [Puniceicoccales bacterium]|jgi:hypothetical protein|nr:hypothetical protein [Puniceicoccales bacterium]